jgi:hypothetical protein
LPHSYAAWPQGGSIHAKKEAPGGLPGAE